MFRNVDALVFGEFFEELSTEMKKAVEEEGRDGDTISLNSLLRGDSRPGDRGDGEKPPKDEDDFLKLHDGNYLKAREAGESDGDGMPTESGKTADV